MTIGPSHAEVNVRICWRRGRQVGSCRSHFGWVGTPAAAAMEDVDPADAAAIAQRLQGKARASAKRSAKRTAPLLASRAPATAHKDLDGELQWLQRCQQQIAQLPPTSRWARHKRATLQKAIELLNVKRCVRAHLQDAARVPRAVGQRPCCAHLALLLQAGAQRRAAVAAGVADSAAQALTAGGAGWARAAAAAGAGPAPST